MSDRRTTDDDADFRRIYEEFYPAVWSHCHRLIGSRAEADDATQDVFLAVYQGLERFRGESTLFTWVYRIATRVALRHRARLRRRGVPLEIDPATATVAPILGHQVKRAIANLGIEHATVLSLFAIEGLSHQQIANILGIPEGTVWSRLHTARKKLAQQLDREE